MNVAIGVPVYFGINQEMAFTMLDVVRCRLHDTTIRLIRSDEMLGDALIDVYEMQMAQIRKETVARAPIFDVGSVRNIW